MEYSDNHEGGKEGDNLRIQTSEAVPPGFYYLMDGDSILYGSLTDLGDNWIASGMVMKILNNGGEVSVIVNKQDWEKSPDLIFKPRYDGE